MLSLNKKQSSYTKEDDWLLLSTSIFVKHNERKITTRNDCYMLWFSFHYVRYTKYTVLFHVIFIKLRESQ